MSDFLGIDLIAGLNQEQSKTQIDAAINTLSTKLKDLKLEIDIDQKALQTIKDFNTEMKKLSQAADKTGQSVKQAMTSDGTIQNRTTQLKRLVAEKARLATAEENQTANAVANDKQRIRSLDELTEVYRKRNRVIQESNKYGEATKIQYQLEDDQGNLRRTVTTDGKDNVLKYKDHDIDAHKKYNDMMKQVASERERIATRLAKIRMSGYGNEKQLQFFDSQATSHDINSLKSLSKEIDVYSQSLTRVAKKDDLQKTIKSINTLHKSGAQRLPKQNVLTDIQTSLNSATTQKEIDAVQTRIQRLQQVMSGRERGFKQLQKLKADDILPTGVVSEVRERLRKAQSPEKVQEVSKGIYELQQRNVELKKQAASESKLANTRSRLHTQLERMNRAQNVTTTSMQRMGRAIDQATGKGAEAQLNRIDVALKRISNSAQDRQKTRELQKQLDLMQKQASMNAANLLGSVHGKISPENKQRIDAYALGTQALTVQTKDAIHQHKLLDKEFQNVKRSVLSADQGMARFSKQMSSAMFRIPIYAAGMAAMYAPLRMFKSAIQEIIEIDTQMTVLERVTDGSENMNTAMTASIDIAERLGNTIAEVNEGLINFARQGYRGDDLTAITEVATVMSNVSDLNVEDAASSLTAAMKGFNIEAQDSIRIVDSLNEVNVSASCYSNVA